MMIKLFFSIGVCVGAYFLLGHLRPSYALLNALCILLVGALFYSSWRK